MRGNVARPTGVRASVVERDDDNLTAEEIKTHSAAVQAAKVKELRAWQHYKCFSRKPRRNARNVIDARWVVKWKWVEEAGKRERVIRARLTVRGFKDLDKNKQGIHCRELS